MYFFKQFRLVFFHPRQFGGSEIAWRVQKARQAGIGAELVEGVTPVRHSARVAPYYGIAQYVHIFVYCHESVHLVADAYSLYVGSAYARCGKDCGGGFLEIVPPVGRILFGPAGTQSLDGGFGFWKKIGSHTASGGRVHYRSFHRRASYVES